MKCEKCGYETHPGDQICINCKAKLSLAHSYVPGIDKTVEIEPVVENKKKNIRFAVFCGIGVLVLILVVVLLLCFFRRA